MSEEGKVNPELVTKILAWLKARLSESSSWTWIVVAASYLGYVLDPSLVEYIAGVAVALISLIQFIKKDPVTVSDLEKVTEAEKKEEEV